MQPTKFLVIFFCTFTPSNNLKNQNFEKLKKKSGDIIILQMTIIWCIVPEIWSLMNRIFYYFGLFFFLFTPPPNNSKNQNFEKLKKNSGDIILVHMCTINGNHMIYGSWDMKRDVQNFLLIFDCTPLTIQKPRFWKTEKNTWRYYFTEVYQKSGSYAILFLRYGTWWM